MAAELWAAIVPAAEGKAVKDALKGHGWLDVNLRPRVAEGRLAFPLVAASVEAVRAGVAAGTPPALHAVVSIEQVEGLAAAKKAPPQGHKKHAVARGLPVAKPRKAPQQRSFGLGVGPGRRSELPPARPVRRVQCPPDAGYAWLSANILSAGEPIVLRGLDLGPCVGGWTPDRLTRACCTTAKVSVHVAAVGERRPGSPNNFVFKMMTFAEAVRRCAIGGDQVTNTCAGDDRQEPEPEPLAPLLAPGERYYLRSVGINSRKEPADFSTLFPCLAAECRLLPSPQHQGKSGEPAGDAAAASAPLPLIDPALYHSSVLRLASANTQLWTHFDGARLPSL